MRDAVFESVAAVLSEAERVLKEELRGVLVHLPHELLCQRVDPQAADEAPLCDVLARVESVRRVREHDLPPPLLLSGSSRCLVLFVVRAASVRLFDGRRATELAHHVVGAVCEVVDAQASESQSKEAYPYILAEAPMASLDLSHEFSASFLTSSERWRIKR